MLRKRRPGRGRRRSIPLAGAGRRWIATRRPTCSPPAAAPGDRRNAGFRPKARFGRRFPVAARRRGLSPPRRFPPPAPQRRMGRGLQRTSRRRSKETVARGSPFLLFTSIPAATRGLKPAARWSIEPPAIPQVDRVRSCFLHEFRPRLALLRNRCTAARWLDTGRRPP